MGDSFCYLLPHRGFFNLSAGWISPWWVPANDSFLKTIANRHGARWNVGFCDAHVENLRTKNLFDRSKPAIAQRWNNDHQPHEQPMFPPLPVTIP
jgi:prepilin-type processing-associated H-X9-DG protein